MCILTKMIHGKKVSNFIFSFAPTKLDNFPLCQASLVLTWSHPKPIFKPPFIVCVFVPRLSHNNHLSLNSSSFFDHQKKKERGGTYTNIPFSELCRLILIKTKHNTNNDTLLNFAVVILIKPKTQYEQWHQAMLVLQKLTSIQTCRFFLDCEFWLIAVSLKSKRTLDTRALRACPPIPPYVHAYMSECLLHPK